MTEYEKKNKESYEESKAEYEKDNPPAPSDWWCSDQAVWCFFVFIFVVALFTTQ